MKKFSLLFTLVLAQWLQLQAEHPHTCEYCIAPVAYCATTTTGDNPENIFTFLPVRFNVFQLTKDTKSVVLYWQTVEEQSSRHYLVERSNDGRLFTVIATIPAKAGSDLNTYFYRDPSPLEGKSYYRLRQIDQNGQDSYSPIRTLKFTIPNQLRIVQHQQALTIYYSGEGNETYTLFNTQGHLVKNGKLVNQRSSITDLMPGLYILCLHTSKTNINRQILVTP